MFSKQNTLPDLVGEKDIPFPCPSHIGPYKIESLFNRGGMSILYLATEPSIPRPLIIKVLSPRLSKNKEISARFLKEAEIIAMTNHPNIVKLYGQGEWEKGLYIAMEFIQGISLRQFIQNHALSQKRALEISLSRPSRRNFAGVREPLRPFPCSPKSTSSWPRELDLDTLKKTRMVVFEKGNAPSVQAVITGDVQFAGGSTAEVAQVLATKG